MKQRPTRPLVIVNIVLLSIVATLALVTRAGARTGQPERARGTYTMVSGAVQGGSSDVIYVIDATNQEMVSIGWDGKGIEVIGHRSLPADARTQGSGR